MTPTSAKGRTSRPRLPRATQRPPRRAGGCDFAVDPRLRSDKATVIWLPSQNSRLVMLTSMPPGMFGGPTLREGRPATIRVASEGTYADLRALVQPQGALISHPILQDAPMAVVLPLDALFDERVDAARRVWRALAGQHQVPRPTFTAQRRRRLKLLLRALDASLLEIGYREIAHGLFGDRVPDDASWRTHTLRATTIRLVREGRALMRGGYLRLLRPARRKR